VTFNKKVENITHLKKGAFSDNSTSLGAAQKNLLIKRILTKSSMMKNIKFTTIAIMIFAGSFAIFSSCKKEKGYYDSMHFVREGGGQIDFTIYLTDNSDTLRAVVSEYEFQDTTLTIIIANIATYSSLFSTFHDAMNNKTKINGNFKQPILPTGTWAYIYFVSNNKKTEVTNTNLRNTLLGFEQIVRDKM